MSTLRALGCCWRGGHSLFGAAGGRGLTGWARQCEARGRPTASQAVFKPMSG